MEVYEGFSIRSNTLPIVLTRLLEYNSIIVIIFYPDNIWIKNNQKNNMSSNMDFGSL